MLRRMTSHEIEGVLWRTCYMKNIESIHVGNTRHFDTIFFVNFGEILFEGHSYQLSKYGQETVIMGLRNRWLYVLEGMKERVFYDCMMHIDRIADEMKAQKQSQFCLSTYPDLLIFLRLIYECSKVFELVILRREGW